MITKLQITGKLHYHRKCDFQLSKRKLGYRTLLPLTAPIVYLPRVIDSPRGRSTCFRSRYDVSIFVAVFMTYGNSYCRANCGPNSSMNVIGLSGLSGDPVSGVARSLIQEEHGCSIYHCQLELYVNRN